MKKRKKGQKVCYFKKKQYLCTIKIKTSRSGAVVARWAHNPKVIGSNPFSATTRLKHELKSFLSYHSPRIPYSLLSSPIACHGAGYA